MVPKAIPADPFKKQLLDSLRRQTLGSHAVRVAKHSYNYANGDMDEMVYFIERGQIKMLMLSPEGKECILAIYTSGDVFCELCLSSNGKRLETAMAMEETYLKQIPASEFYIYLSSNSLLEGFVQYMAGRIADQQQVIANLLTVDSEQRLGKTLLQLARKLGKKDIFSTRIEQKISHEELSEMVGTTRPRISLFMQKFRNLGLIEITKEHYIIIKEQNLTDYLKKFAWPCCAGDYLARKRLKLQQSEGINFICRN
jgi:CRP/FNR family transcriptional regulator, cyclic AMP receptor protein